MRFFSIALVSLLFIVACNQTPREIKVVDPTQTSTNHQPRITDRDYRPLKVAVSAILSPKETFESYEEIFRHISRELDVPVEFHQRKTYGEINQMLEEGQLDFAFICSGAYIDLDQGRGVDLLVVPVSGGEPYYKAYIIAGPASGAQTIEDLRGATFAFTDPLSNTGYLYAKYRLHEIGENPEDFFETTLFTYGHDISIQMVAKGIVEAATVDHLVFEYIKTNNPERVQEIRIVEVSENFGIPPVVASSRLGSETRQKVLDIFLEMHNHPHARELINNLLIDKFIEGNDDNYNSIRIMKTRVNQP